MRVERKYLIRLRFNMFHVIKQTIGVMRFCTVYFNLYHQWCGQELAKGEEEVQKNIF